MKKLAWSTIVAVLLAATLAGGPPPAASNHEPLVVILVRHGEKVDRSRDAALSAAGRERAAALAAALRSAKIERVHSSGFKRTRDTAAPVAAGYGVDVEEYDHEDLPALVEKLRRTGGRHLVVGHSTTTPKVVERLGGDPGAAFNESGEYDRLYIVTIGRDGAASTVLMRYGKSYQPEQAK